METSWRPQMLLRWRNCRPLLLPETRKASRERSFPWTWRQLVNSRIPIRVVRQGPHRRLNGAVQQIAALCDMSGRRRSGNQFFDDARQKWP